MGKTLYLVRHAKSSWTDMTISDFDRPLDKRGLRDAPEMGRRLRARNVCPDMVLCSPAKRTRQTWALLQEHIGKRIGRIRFEKTLYEASLETLLQLVRTLPDDCAAAMLIGHNPSMGWLADRFSDVRIERMPTCAVATLQLGINHWDDAATSTGRLIDFDYPKRDHSKDERLR